MVTMVPRCTGGLSLLPVVKMSWGKKSKKKTSVLTNFHFLCISSDSLVSWSPWSPQVTRTDEGYLCLLLLLKWAEDKNVRKDLVFWPIFVIWSISSDTLVPWSPWSTQGTNTQVGYLCFCWSKWAEEKNLRKKPSVLANFRYLVNLPYQTIPNGRHKELT